MTKSEVYKLFTKFIELVEPDNRFIKTIDASKLLKIGLATVRKMQDDGRLSLCFLPRSNRRRVRRVLIHEVYEMIADKLLKHELVTVKQKGSKPSFPTLRSNRQSSSKYRGVCMHSASGLFRANITVGRKTMHLGYFKDEQEADKAYNAAAIKYHGEFAKLNKI